MTGRMTLRTRLVMLVVAAIVPLFGLSIFKAWVNSDAAINRATANLQFAASLVAANQERMVDSAHQLLISIANVPGLSSEKSLDCQRYFKTLKEQFSIYANLGIIGVDGHARCHGFDSSRPAYLGDRDYFRAAVTRRSFVAGEYIVGRLSGKPSITFALPMLDGDGRVTNVVYVSVDLTEMAKSVAAIQLPPGAAVGIHDRNGVLLASKPELPIKVGQKVASVVLREAVQAKSTGVREGKDAAGEPRLWAFMPSGASADSAFFVAISINRDLVVGPGQRQLGLELAVLALVAFLGGWIAWMMGGRTIVKPTREILDATRLLQKGQLDVRIPMHAIEDAGEFTKIADGFNVMAESLQQREQELEAELARSRQARATLDLTVNSMQEGLIAVDASGRPLLVNEAASRLFVLDPAPTVLSAEWPQHLGLYLPGADTLYAFDQLPLYKALQGQSGGPQHILVRNAAVPAGRLISCSYRPLHSSDGLVGGLMVFADITQLEQLQLAQVQSYEKLRAIQRKLLDSQRLGRMGSWEIDPLTQRIWWSDEVYELTGLTPESFDGRYETFLQLIHPDDRADYLLRREQSLQRRSDFVVEYRIITPAASVRWIYQLGKFHVDEKGQAAYLSGVIQDITARKQSELALVHTTDLLRRTGEMARVGGWELVLDGMRLTSSEQVLRIHDLEPGAPWGAEDAINSYPPEARKTFIAAVNAATGHGTPWDLELPMITQTGRRIWVRTQGQAFMQDGKVVRLAGALQDITAQHESREHLRLLESSISRLSDMVLITEAEPLGEPGPRIVFVNDAFVRRTGYSREEVLGKTPRILQGPQTQRAELDRIGAALRAWQPVQAELVNYTKSGEPFWLDLDIVPVADSQGGFTHWVAVERDITQRKLAQQALVESEQRYAALFEGAPVPMWIVDDQTHAFVAVNGACIERYGYTREAFLSMTIFDIRSDMEAQRLKAEIASGVHKPVNRRVHRSRDGADLDVETVSRKIQYAGRAARLVVGFDVSAQVKAEKDAQEYLFTLQRAADAASAITWHQTLDGTMQEVAEQARGVIGAHQAAVSLTFNSDWAQAIHALSLSEKYAAYRDLMEPPDGTGIYAVVCEANRSMRLTQAELEVHPRWRGFGSHAGKHPAMRGWLAVPLVSRSGKNMGLLQLSDKYEGEFTQQDEYVAMELAQLASIAIENVQLLEEVGRLNAGLEQKVAERTAALTRQEALFRALAERAPQVIWTADPSGAPTYYNQAWFDLVGGRFSDWAGARWLTAIHPEDLSEVQASWQLASASRSQYENIRRLRARDGSYHTMSSRATPVLDERGELAYWVGIDADITEIKTIEAALRLSNQELEAFSYSVSHDLRSPLNTIDGFSRLLSKQLPGHVNEKSRHYLARIQAGVAQMGQLIEDLLSLAQVSRAQLRVEPVDLSALSRRILGEWQARDPERRVEVHVESGLQAHGDSRLVGVVMENLLSNAWKFTSRKAEASISVTRQPDAAGLPVFVVRDNGAGFDMAYADKLFNPFQRLHAASEFAGTGIGLASASRVIRRHGGRLWAQSEPGCGAAFFFTLPRTAVAV